MAASTHDLSLDTLNRIGRALVDENRCRILLRLLDGPCYPTDLAEALGLSRANTSNHLTCLRGCGLVAAEPQGRRVRYELADAALADGLRALLRAALVIDDPECRR
jgi:DNA-binding transcriptional ArsR family regulator